MCTIIDFTSKLRPLIAIAFALGISGESLASERQATITQNGQAEIQYYSSSMPSGDHNQSAPESMGPGRAQNSSLWIFQASFGLTTDHDHDGHYSNFTLSLDIDTAASAPTIYAVLYMSLAGGPWTEYAVTGNFTVYGTGSRDTYTIDAALDSGYPSGYYDQLIEIYDASSHELLISYGPNDSHSLRGLPFESRYHDNSFSLNTDITLSFSGTGSLGLPLLLPLFSVFALRRSSISKIKPRKQ